MIEPNIENVSMIQFKDLKAEIDEVILQGQKKVKSIKESSDSTSKKLIYQIAFKDVEHISPILKDIEDKFGSKICIDIEINSLEDAYIQIQKEEEKDQEHPSKNDLEECQTYRTTS